MKNDRKNGEKIDFFFHLKNLITFHRGLLNFGHFWPSNKQNRNKKSVGNRFLRF